LIRARLLTRAGVPDALVRLLSDTGNESTNRINFEYLFDELKSTIRSTGEDGGNMNIPLCMDEQMLLLFPLVLVLSKRGTTLEATSCYLWPLVEQAIEIQGWMFKAFVKGQQLGREVPGSRIIGQAREEDSDDVLEEILACPKEAAMKFDCSAGDVRTMLNTLQENGETLERGGYEHDWFPLAMEGLEQVFEWKEADEAANKRPDDTCCGGDGASGS
jgi:hypothetical protein